MSPVVSLARTEVACFQSEQFARELFRSLDLSEFVFLARQFACYQSLFCLVTVVYIVTVILTAVLCCP